MTREATPRYDGLTVAQTRTLGQIAMGVDTGHPPRAIAVLMARGLIERRADVIAGGRFGPVAVARYEMPLHEYMRYCQWCADTIPDDEVPAVGSPVSDRTEGGDNGE